MSRYYELSSLEKIHGNATTGLQTANTSGRTFASHLNDATVTDEIPTPVIDHSGTLHEAETQVDAEDRDVTRALSEDIHRKLHPIANGEKGNHRERQESNSSYIDLEGLNELVARDTGSDLHETGTSYRTYLEDRCSQKSSYRSHKTNRSEGKQKRSSQKSQPEANKEEENDDERRESNDSYTDLEGLDELAARDTGTDIHETGTNHRTFLEDRRSRTISHRSHKSNKSGGKSKSKIETWMQLLTVSCWLFFFSIFGALARVGLTKLTTYPGSPLSGVIWANFAGCVVMGFISEEVNIFAAPGKKAKADEESSHINGATEDKLENEEEYQPWGVEKKLIPLYIGIATGFCGSLTSFSTWMKDVFFGLSDTEPHYQRHSGYNVQVILAQIIGTLALSLAGLSFGIHLSILLSRYTRTIPVRLRPHIDRMGIFLGLGCWIGIILMSVYIPSWRGKALLAGVFAPVGAWFRFMLSKKFNPLVAWFPLGTFSVNVIGTIVLAVGLTLQNAHIDMLSCDIVQGIDDGFCGALTTVSTFMVELKALRRNHSSFLFMYKTRN